MSETIYDAPKSNLDTTETKILSASEKLAQSRRDIEESSAKERLNFVWGIRFATDILFILVALFGIFGSLARSGDGLVM